MVPGQVISRDEILNHVWSENEFPTSRTIDNFIMRLRRLIEVDPETYEVRADGELLTCEPATTLPLAQRYSLF